MALWTLIPDKIDDLEDKPARFGAFVTTMVLLPGRDGRQDPARHGGAGRAFHNVWAVTAGTTIGMMLANVPAVFLGNALLKRVPLKLVHGIAAVLFIVAGVLMLGETAGWF
jgi:putative Ca2+/H+ antiporter (TMEM165/GDT1 family)